MGEGLRLYDYAAYGWKDGIMKADILLIEDNLQNRYLATFLLERSGHRVHQAESGPQGLEMAARIRPDLILLDVQLPGMDGQRGGDGRCTKHQSMSISVPSRSSSASSWR